MGETISSLVFRPPTPTPIRSNRHFWLNLDDDGNRVPAFFIKRRKAKVTFLFSHGNAEDLGMMYHRMKELARVACVNVMAYDYSGYGLSTGEPTQENCFLCISAAFGYLRDVRHIQPEDIVLYGRSVGTGPTCYLAAKTAAEGRSVAGVILHSPFLSIFRIVVDLGFSMAGDMFRNVEYAPKIKCPVLIIHGTEDEVVPFWHGQELLKKLAPEYRAPPYFAVGLGHNNIEVHNKEEYICRITDFLHRYVPAMRNDGKENLDGPIEVPEKERGTVEGNHSRWINETWVRHGAGIMKEALHFRKNNTDNSKQQHEMKPTQPLEKASHKTDIEPFEEFEVVPGVKMLSRLKDCDTLVDSIDSITPEFTMKDSKTTENLESESVADEVRCDETSDSRTDSTSSEVRSQVDLTSQEVVLNFEKYT